MSATSLFNVAIAADVEALIAKAGEGNANRAHFVSALPEEMLRGVLHAALWAHACRSSEFSAAYAWEALWKALRVDIAASSIVWIAPDADKIGEGE